MEKKQLIYRALLELANQRTAGHTNPWPRIASAIEQKVGRKRPVRLSVARAIVFILVLLLVGTTVAYAYFRFDTLYAIDKKARADRPAELG